MVPLASPSACFRSDPFLESDLTTRWLRSQHNQDIIRLYLAPSLATFVFETGSACSFTYRCPRGRDRRRRRRCVRALAGERGEGTDIEGDEPTGRDTVAGGHARLSMATWWCKNLEFNKTVTTVLQLQRTYRPAMKLKLFKQRDTTIQKKQSISCAAAA